MYGAMSASVSVPASVSVSVLICVSACIIVRVLLCMRLCLHVFVYMLVSMNVSVFAFVFGFVPVPASALVGVSPPIPLGCACAAWLTQLGVRVFPTIPKLRRLWAIAPREQLEHNGR